MSHRNERHRKKAYLGQKGAKRKAPSKSPANTSINKNTSSSDDDYAGVDLVSDTSDADEPDVEDAEASAIVESGRVTDSEEDSDYAFNEDDLEFNGFDLPEYLHDDPQFFEEQLLLMPASELDAPDDGDQQARPQSSSSSSDSQDDSFDLEYTNADGPDSFWAVDSLNPAFQRAIGGNDDAVVSSEAGSYWDLEAERGQQPILEDENNSKERDVDDSSDDSSSGFESDDGETTDEDENLGARFIPPERSVLRPVESSDEEEVVPVVRRKLPRFGTFVQDDQKPYLLVDSSGKHLRLFPARYPRPDSSMQDFALISPMVTSANVMMSAALNADLYGTNPYGPPEAFFSQALNFPGGSYLAAESSSYDEEDDDADADDDDADNILNLEDMIDFGDTSSDESEAENEQDTEPPSSTPAKPAETGKERSKVLGHLDGGLVGAFRNNQRQHQLLSRNEVTRDGLAFTGRLGQGPIRGIKGGRLAAASTPITPARRQKVPRNLIESSPGSPLARSVAQKRKASGQASEKSHKRNRSIV